ncbi:MAG: ATP-binding cassette domain-containing protein [Fibrobacterota bacterium]|nr:ATP-binding cassette domain-containing protein [Fibrobacterota bacterium]QQS07427.1 MAG: ATP-binding cassette domain-containing protein [Fibrobacterota bacterium]
MTKKPSISCRGLELRREGRAVLTLERWDVHPGERWVVMGPNGCGKSTLAMAALGRLHPWDGSIEILGRVSGQDEIVSLRSRIGFSGDALEPLVEPVVTALELVSTGFVGTLGLRFDRPSPGQTRKAKAELESWGLAEHMDRPLGKLSLGQRRRAWLARALAGDPRLLILDEPCAGLDPRAREDLVDHLESLSVRRPDLPIVLVTHHLEEIPAGFSRVLLLRDGKALAQGEIGSVLRSEDFSSLFGPGFQVRKHRGRWSLLRRD